MIGLGSDKNAILVQRGIPYILMYTQHLTFLDIALRGFATRQGPHLTFQQQVGCGTRLICDWFDRSALQLTCFRCLAVNFFHLTFNILIFLRLASRRWWLGLFEIHLLKLMSGWDVLKSHISRSLKLSSTSLMDFKSFDKFDQVFD